MINPLSEKDKTIYIKRLIYQSWHRGCKETDGALGGYAKARLSTLSDDELAVFEQLLAEDDWDIWNWLTEKTAPTPLFRQLIADIQAYTQGKL